MAVLVVFLPSLVCPFIKLLDQVIFCQPGHIKTNAINNYIFSDNGPNTPTTALASIAFDLHGDGLHISHFS